MDKITSIFYHECGHLILSQIFDNILDIEFITVDEAISKKIDPSSKGGMKAKLSKKGTDLTIEDHDSLILIFLAGLCSDDLYEQNLEIDEANFKMSTWGKKFSTLKYSGDAELINKRFYFLSLQKNLDWEHYISESIKFVYQILQDYTLRSIIDSFYNKIISNSNHTITKNEIANLISESEFSKWKEDNIISIMNNRSKLLNA